MVFFFFQAEDGIRDVAVTGVQTCALPISGCQRGNGRISVRTERRCSLGAPICVGCKSRSRENCRGGRAADRAPQTRSEQTGTEIGRAAGRGRGEKSVGGGSLKKKKEREGA